MEHKLLYFVFYFLVPPLLVIEFLHRIMDIFTEYFSECSEQRIKEHYVTVYEVNVPLLNLELIIYEIIMFINNCYL